MNAVIDLHFSPWVDFSSPAPTTCKGPTLYCSCPRPSRRTQAIPATDTLIQRVWQQGLAVYNAPRFNCDLLRICALQGYPSCSLRRATSVSGSISSQIKTNR